MDAWLATIERREEIMRSHLQQALNTVPNKAGDGDGCGFSALPRTIAYGIDSILYRDVNDTAWSRKSEVNIYSYPHIAIPFAKAQEHHGDVRRTFSHQSAQAIRISKAKQTLE